MNNIKSVFDNAMSHVDINTNLLKRIKEYGLRFINRNEEHVAFFGGNLTGVHQIKFRNSDYNEWCDNVIDIDDLKTRSEILRLPGINPEWVRGTDVMNLSCLYLTHAIYHSDHLNSKQKADGMIDVLLVLHYKFITSLMQHYFRYPVAKPTAIAVYAALSRKFHLKIYGSWNALLRARCEDIISPKSIHLKTIIQFDKDNKIQYFITDTQGRMRSIVKYIWKVFDQIKKADTKISNTSFTGKDLEGDMVVKDMARSYTPYQRYLHGSVTDQRIWIKPELLQIINDAMFTMPPEGLVATLELVSKEYKPASPWVEILDDILLHAFEYLSNEQSSFLKNQDMGKLILKLRAIYMSSRSTDPTLLKLRENIENHVRKAYKSKNAAVIASIRTGLMLYVILFTFTMRSYT